jgi:DNA-binding NarL/FixJ family response regulator
MTVPLASQSHIVVADPRPHDYQQLAALAGRYGWHVHLLTNASATLRLARSTPAALWMVNSRLPDMSGFDLLEMLREQLKSARVFIVADRYDPEHESRACRIGAALYVCKAASGSFDCATLLDALADTRAVAAEHLRDPPAPLARYSLIETTRSHNFAAADVPPDSSTHR